MTTNSTTETIERITIKQQNISKVERRSRCAPIEGSKLPDEVLESIWLDEIREGANIRSIARREKLSVRRVQMGVTRARLREMAKIRRRSLNSAKVSSNQNESGLKADAKILPRLVPLFPIGSFTPGSSCGHRHPIRAGSVFCCMVCHASGMDDHPELKRDPKTDPAPELKPSAPPRQATRRLYGKDSANAVADETRKARRKRRNDAKATTTAIMAD